MYKKNIFFILFLLGFIILSSTGLIALSNKYIVFDNFFIDGTMRIDYYHIGNAKTEEITLDKIYKYGDSQDFMICPHCQEQ